jgi:DNA-binding winged helix-turn-helix (wHTH) protein
MPSTLPPLVRFANFEVNLRAGEVRRKGSKVRLQEQPFSVLTVLLESAGEIVTRDELRKRLQRWSFCEQRKGEGISLDNATCIIGM